MIAHLLNKYPSTSYLLIGIELTNENTLISVNETYENIIRNIFNNVNDCQEFLKTQQKSQRTVLIISGYPLHVELSSLQKNASIHAIYLYSKSLDFGEQYRCIYKKEVLGKYFGTFMDFLTSFWFLIGLIVLGLIAYYFPNVGASDGALYAKYTIKWGCVILIFLLSSLSISTTDLFQQIYRVRLNLIIQTFNLIVIPLIVFLISVILLICTTFNHLLLFGLMLMGCMPTSITISIIGTTQSRGNEGSTLFNVLLGNILGIFVSPGLIALLMKMSSFVDVVKMANLNGYINIVGYLSLTALLPLLIGQIVNYVWTEKMNWARTNLYFVQINGFALLLLVWTTLSDVFQSNILANAPFLDFAIVTILSTILYVLFTLIVWLIARLPNPFICCKKIDLDKQSLLRKHQPKLLNLFARWRFPRDDTITIIFCSATKCLSIGIPLINIMFSNLKYGPIGLLSLPLIIYYLIQLLAYPIIVILLQYWVPNEDYSKVDETIEK